MRHLILFTLFVFVRIQSFGQIQFKLPNEILHYRIDLKNGFLWKEKNSRDWQELGQFELVNVDVKEIPANAVINTFYVQPYYLLTVAGTGQVYQLNKDEKKITRLDKTYYRGGNFGAIQFVRNDTLYSLGGNGFWHANNIETYFSFESKEWEMTSIPEEAAPRWMKSDFGGYDSLRKVICVIEFPALYETKNYAKNFRYFEKDLRNKLWTLFGDVNVGLIKDLGIKRLESQFLDGKFFFFDGAIFIWADPVNNRIYQFNTVIPMFNKNFEFVFRNGYIYSYHRMNALSKVGDVVEIDSISIEKLKSMSTYKGPFYIKPYPADLLGYGAAAMLILSAGVIYAYRKRKPRKAPESIIEPLDGLPAGASDFLLACLQFPQGHVFSSQLFTEMMGYGSYSYETQRSVRAKLIKGINNYFWAHYRLDDVIIRQTANEDKRFSVYLIAEAHYDTLKKLLNV